MDIEDILKIDDLEDLIEVLTCYIDQDYPYHAAAFIHRAYMLGVSNQSKN